MAQLFVNNFETTVGATLSSGGTTLTLASGTGVPAVAAPNWWLLTIEEGANIEIVKVTSCSAAGTSLTIARAQEGTSQPASFSTSATVKGKLTKGSADNFVQQDGDYGYFGKYNAGGQARPVSGSYGAVGWNHESGTGDIGFWNCYESASRPFYFRMKTAAATHRDLMWLLAAGNLYLPCTTGVSSSSGALIVGTSGSDGGILTYGGIYAKKESTFEAVVNFTGGVKVTQRVNAITSTTSITPDCDAYDLITVYTTAATGITFNNPTGTPRHGQLLMFDMKDTANARAFTWTGTQYRAMGNALPTGLIAGKHLMLLFRWNALNSENKWDLIAVIREA